MNNSRRDQLIQSITSKLTAAKPGSIIGLTREEWNWFAQNVDIGTPWPGSDKIDKTVSIPKLIPQKEWIQDRVDLIIETMQSYAKENKQIPIELLTELNFHISWLKIN